MEEYTKPEDRRFHSQTNTCPQCGISMQLLDNLGMNINIAQSAIFKEASALLKKGKIIAIKNTSGFLLCCNAENAEAIKTLRIRKNRKNKPFALLFPNLKCLKETVTINIETETALKSTERPICIVNSLDLNGRLAVDQIAPGLHQLGVMLPYTGILQLLANELEFPIIATSGNIHGSPIISKNDDAVQKLGAIADCFLVHNLSIEHPQDDSVLKHSFKFRQPVLFRRARGLAPNYFNAGIASNQRIMAMGAHLKSSIAFYPNDYLYISQYIGNLDNYDVYERFTENIDSFISIFQQNPSVILVDAHPMYQSTTYGRELAKCFNINAVEIQHHKAHFAASLAESNLFDKRVLGVIFDGTGYGDDGAIWGGEFFNYNSGKIERTGHVNYFDWLLSDKMSKEPRLSLFSIGGDYLEKVFDQKFESHELKSFKTLKANNKLKTSSVGRLFDAVASLLNLTDSNSYEGEAAILLENQISTYNLSSCKSYLKNPKNGINPVEIIRNIQIEQERAVPVSTCVENFIFTLANAIIRIAESKDYEHIACSGGVFQNTTLIDMLLEICPDTMTLYFHRDLSPNDENISFGQIMYYLNCM
jgi:hydrogenase maturation protein HypF